MVPKLRNQPRSRCGPLVFSIASAQIGTVTNFATTIACGGDGQRLGGDKAGQALGGMTLIERAVWLARDWGGPVALAVRNDGAEPDTDLPVLVDPAPDLGPIGALASGFAFAKECDASHVLLIACDQPFLPADLPARLAAAIGDAGVALPVSAGHDQNMAALWRCDGPALTSYIDGGNRSLWGFAEVVGITRVAWECEGADPFADIDTQADLSAAEARLKSS